MASDAHGSAIQSGLRMMAILDFVAQAKQDVGVSQISEGLQLAPSTVHRLLATLTAGGLIEQRSNSKYRLGVKLIELGHAALERFDLRNEAVDELRQLAETSRLTANLAQLDGGDVIYLEKIAETASFTLNIRVGQRRRAYCRALGKVLLAALDETEIRRRLGEPLPALTPRTITDVDALAEHLRQVRSQGYAVDDEEAQLGCICVAAPVFDGRGVVVAAISLSGTAVELRARPQTHWIDLVRAASARISQRLGYRASATLERG